MKISMWQSGGGFYGIFREWMTQEFQRLGHAVEPLPVRGTPNQIGDLMFSMNFSPELARLAKAIRKPYVCWVWDALVNHTLLNPDWASGYTFMFQFARSDLARFKKAGYTQVFHLPASTQAAALKAPAQEKTCAVAFVGHCYPDAATPFRTYKTQYEGQHLPPELGLRALEEFIEETARKPVHRLRDFFLEFMTERHPGFFASVPVPNRTLCHPVTDSTLDFFVNTLLYHEVDIRQRSRALQALAPVGVDVWGEGWAPHVRAGIHLRGSCDLKTQAGAVLASSRIALNLARTLSDGANMRSFEIPAAGAFQLALYSDELASLFEDGREIVLFRTFEEARDKAAYYLAHDTERERIAAAGHERFLRDHTLDRRCRRMMELLRGAGLV